MPQQERASLLFTDLFEHRSYFQFGIVIGAGTTVVDVGANIGLFALQASREAEGVRIFSLEPLPPIYEVLKANYDLHEIRGDVHRAVEHARRFERRVRQVDDFLQEPRNLRSLDDQGAEPSINGFSRIVPFASIV